MLDVIISCTIIIITVQCILAVVMVAMLKPRQEKIQFIVKDDLSGLESFGVKITGKPVELENDKDR